MRNRISRTNDQLTSGTPFEMLSTRLTYQFAYHFAHCVSLSWLRFVDVIPWKTLTTEEGVARQYTHYLANPFLRHSQNEVATALGVYFEELSMLFQGMHSNADKEGDRWMDECILNHNQSCEQCIHPPSTVLEDFLKIPRLTFEVRLRLRLSKDHSQY